MGATPPSTPPPHQQRLYLPSADLCEPKTLSLIDRFDQTLQSEQTRFRKNRTIDRVMWMFGGLPFRWTQKRGNKFFMKPLPRIMLVIISLLH